LDFLIEDLKHNPKGLPKLEFYDTVLGKNFVGAAKKKRL
jgi:hypothetical protein